MCTEYMEEKEKLIPLRRHSSSIGKIDEMVVVPRNVLTKD